MEYLKFHGVFLLPYGVAWGAFPCFSRIFAGIINRSPGFPKHLGPLRHQGGVRWPSWAWRRKMHSTELQSLGRRAVGSAKVLKISRFFLIVLLFSWGALVIV